MSQIRNEPNWKCAMCHSYYIVGTSGPSSRFPMSLWLQTFSYMVNGLVRAPIHVLYKPVALTRLQDAHTWSMCTWQVDAILEAVDRHVYGAIAV